MISLLVCHIPKITGLWINIWLQRLLVHIVRCIKYWWIATCLQTSPYNHIPPVIVIEGMLDLTMFYCYRKQVPRVRVVHLSRLPTRLWAQTTEPRSFHVPARLSIRTILRIWKKRIPRSVEAANISLVEPTMITMNVDSIITPSEVYKTWQLIHNNSTQTDHCHWNTAGVKVAKNIIRYGNIRRLPRSVRMLILWYFTTFCDSRQ